MEKMFTRPEWCRLANIAESTYFNWRRQGLTPAEIKIGGTVRITERAHREWLARMEDQAKGVAA